MHNDVLCEFRVNCKFQLIQFAAGSFDMSPENCQCHTAAVKQSAKVHGPLVLIMWTHHIQNSTIAAFSQCNKPAIKRYYLNTIIPIDSHCQFPIIAHYTRQFNFLLILMVNFKFLQILIACHMRLSIKCCSNLVLHVQQVCSVCVCEGRGIF